MTELDKEIREGLYDPKTGKKPSKWLIFVKAHKHMRTPRGLIDLKAISRLWHGKESKESSKRYDVPPPPRWYEAMVKGIKKSSDVRNPYAVVKSIWSRLSLSKRAEIKAREAKGERFKYDLPLPIDKPTKGTGTVRMVKSFKLAEVQVNLSVKDYLSTLKSGLFSKMKRNDGSIALVARCKSPEKNVNLFIDQAGK